MLGTMLRRPEPYKSPGFIFPERMRTLGPQTQEPQRAALSSAGGSAIKPL
jgi:hypothetical protein